MNIEKSIKQMILGFMLVSLPFVGGCGDNTITWEEEVKLLDGRVITVTQKRRIDRENVEREAWLMFRLPEFGDKEIVWHENLEPQILNIFGGKLIRRWSAHQPNESFVSTEAQNHHTLAIDLEMLSGYVFHLAKFPFQSMTAICILKTWQLPGSSMYL